VTVALWARILQSVDGSRIVLKHSGYDDASTRERILACFVSNGVRVDRVQFLGFSLRAEHLAVFGQVDISLDPYPMGGGISTWESLQVGVPVVAKLGNSIGSRVAGAIVSAVGLSDWVANSDDEYFAIATKFSVMPEHLQALRQELPARIAESEAGNGVKYTRAVEAAYRTMWQDYCRSAPA
jgi:predicted O-linked N-acetylglucosamine transferase (SPINDLY family)